MKFKMACFVLFCCVFFVNGIYADEEPVIYSTSPNVVAQGDPEPQPAAAGNPKITFSEYPVDTFITNQYADLGIIFGGDSPFISTDGSNPTTPVLSGTPQFQGSIEGAFVNPADETSPAYVSWFSLDAGYFNEVGSTRLEWFGPDGVKMGEVYNTVLGIETFHIEGANIAFWRISMPESGDSNGFAIDNISFGELYAVRLIKTDDVDGCTSPQESIVYTICFENTLDQTVQDPFIIDWLPDDVLYPQSVWTADFTDPNDPNTLIFCAPDPGYNSEDHSYVWFLDDMDPNASGCVQLGVVVRDSAPPGGYLHNVAELYGTIWVVSDPNDPNTLTPEIRLVARAELDTAVCCYEGTIDTLYVDQNATGSNSGLNWPNAFTDLQDALDFARNPVCGQVLTIYVAQGTYSSGGNEGDTFTLPDGVFVYGGFPTGGGEFSQRNPKRYETTLSGYIDETTRNTTVVVMGNETLLDSFTISNAAEYCVYGSGVDFAVANCTVEGSDQYGIRAANSNVNLSWCTVQNNHEGIWHSGAGFVLNVENCWFKKQGQFGIFSDMSTPVLRNSIITESDLSQTGNAGVRMVNPSSQPIFANCTLSHNKDVAVSQVGGTLPSLVNSIVYHNNDGGRQLSANLDPDVVAQYCNIADCNEVNQNINADPEFAYFDPDNVRIMAGSPCHDSGLTLQESYTQVDMDNRTRVLGSAVDRGAYEIECDDTSNSFDLNADGIINLDELGHISRIWLAHDPNDPALNDPNHVDYDYLNDPNSPGYVTASSIAAWYPDGHTYNYVTTGYSQYAIDLADLMYWTEEAPWLWRACWLTETELLEMTSGGGEMLLMDAGFVIIEEAEVQSYNAMGIDTAETQQKSVQEQMFDLATAIVFLEQIWLDEPDIQQEIDTEAWYEFMDALCQELVDLYMPTD